MVTKYTFEGVALAHNAEFKSEGVNETEIMPSHVKAVLKRPRKNSSRTFVAIAVQLCNLVAKKRALAHGCMKRLRDVAVAEQADVI